MTGLDTVRELLTDCLTKAGVAAVTAWGPQSKCRPREAVVAVSLQRCQALPGGFQDYLGERYDPETDRWQEIYGRKATLTFGLDIYAPGQDGGKLCQETFDRLAEVLQEEPPAGLRVETLIREETGYDGELGLFHCPVRAVCGTCIYAVTDESGIFVDFEVRGGRSNE